MMQLGFNVTAIVLASIFCTTILVIVAVLSGINGALLASAIAALIALPTYVMTRYFDNKKASGEKKILSDMIDHLTSTKGGSK